MTTAAPYENAEQIKALKSANDTEALEKLRTAYHAYFMENQCELLNDEAWAGLGAHFMKLAIEGAHMRQQTREEFEKDTAGFLKQEIPAWIQKVVYVQTQEDGTYYLALPPKELARQAHLHSLNPQAKGSDYVIPPIYQKKFVTDDPATILNTRICDYVISHCG